MNPQKEPVSKDHEAWLKVRLRDPVEVVHYLEAYLRDCLDEIHDTGRLPDGHITFRSLLDAARRVTKAWK